MKTNAVAITTEDTANIAAQSADVVPEAAPSKKGASHKKGAPQGQGRGKAAKRASKAKANKKDRPRTRPTAARQGTAKARVIAMISRKGGATLEEICKATGWQKHTTRGLISTLGKKAGLQIASSRRESDKARVYEIAR